MAKEERPVPHDRKAGPQPAAAAVAPRRLLPGLGLALLASGGVRAQPAAGSAPGLPPYRRFTVRSPDGLAIAAQEWGNPAGPPIVFIHGVLQSHLSFIRQYAGPLARDFRLISYDLRGHGNSDKPDDPVFYTDGRRWGDELKAVIESAGLRRPVLVPWSLGGVVVANYLQAHGDGDIAGIDFVDALLKRGPEFSGDPATRDLLPGAASTDLPVRVDALRGFLRACFAAQPDQESFERMLAFNAMVPSYVIAHILRGVSLDAEEALRATRRPVLVTFGTADRLISPRMAQWTQGVIGQARLSLYESIGHAPFHEDAPRFDSILARFVREAGAT